MSDAAEVRDDVFRRIGEAIGAVQRRCRVGLMEPADLLVRLRMIAAVREEAAEDGWVYGAGKRSRSAEASHFGARTVALVARVDGAIRVGVRRADSLSFYSHPLSGWPGLQWDWMAPFEQADLWRAWAAMPAVLALDDVEIDAVFEAAPV